MSKLIEFLEAAGSASRFSAIDADELEQALAGAGVSAELMDALRRRDAAAAARLLGGDAKVALLLFPAEPEPQQPDGDAPDAPQEPAEQEQKVA